MAFSVRASKTHEVLMVVFAIWAVWLLSLPVWYGMARAGMVAKPPEWFDKLNPFMLAYAPYARPGYVEAKDVAVFAAVAALLSAAAILFAICRLRADLAALGQESRHIRALKLWTRTHLFSWWPSPSLDGNPVLWREWHRNRPTRMARLVGVLFTVGTILGMAMGVAGAVKNGVGVGSDMLGGFSIWAVTFGLLILSATAPTSLSEERVRGSLDVLLTTPVPTLSIVLGKWWATYRRALPLVLLSALSGFFVATASLDRPLWLPTQLMDQIRPPTTRDRVIAGLLPSAFLLAHAAATTSFGLAMATWFRRTGAAVAASVTGFVVMSVGWVVAILAVIRPLLEWWSSHFKTIPNEQLHALTQSLLALSPEGGQATPLDTLMHSWNHDRTFAWVVLICELALVILAAAVFLGLTLLTFNRCLGRMSESTTDTARSRLPEMPLFDK
jgi:hypothetical protein